MDNIIPEAKPFYGVSTLSSNIDIGDAQTKQEQILEAETPWSEKIRAMKDTVKNTSWIQQLGNQTFDNEGNFYEPEENFKLDTVGINNMLSSRELADTFDNFNKVSKATSQSQLTDILDDLELKQFEMEHANQVLTNKQLTGTIIGTELFSLENVVGIGLGVGLGIKTVKGSLGITGTAETIAAAARIETGDYKDWEEGMLWIGLSVVPEMAIIHGINKFEAGKITEKISDTPTQTQMVNERGELLLAMPTEDRMKAIAREENAKRDAKRIFEASRDSANREAKANKIDTEATPIKQDVPFMNWHKEQQRLLQESYDFKNLSDADKALYTKALKDEELRYRSKIESQVNEVEGARGLEIKAIDDEIKATTDTNKIEELEMKKAEINRSVDEYLTDVKDGKKLEDKDLSTFTKTKIADEKREIEEVNMYIRNEIEVKDMLNKFETNPKYDNSTVKSILRNIQKVNKKVMDTAKKALINSNKIDEIKGTIKVLESKISTIKARAKELNIELSRGEKGAITKLEAKLKAEKPKLSSSLDARNANVKARELNRLTRLVGETFDDTNDAIRAIAKHIKGSSLDEIAEVKASVDLLSKTNPEFRALQADIEEIIKTKNIPDNFSTKGLSRKQQAMIVGAAIVIADSAQASEDDEPILGVGIGQMVMAIAILAGIKAAYSGFKGNASITEAIKAKGVGMKKAFTFSETNTGATGTRIKQMKDEMLDRFSATGLFDIHASIAANGGLIKQYGDDMLFSFENGKYSAELEAAHLADSATMKVYKEVDNSFKLWLKEQNVTTMKNIMEHDTLMKRFDGEVATALETGTGSKAVMQLANVMKKEDDKMWDLLKESGVLGADSIKKINGYFTRMWKPDYVQTLIRMNPKNKTLLADAIKNALIKAGNTRLEAIDDNVASLMNSFEKTYDNTRIKSPNEVFSKIEDLLEAGVDSKEVEARLAKYADRNNRLKGRLDFDVKELDGLKLVDGNGDEFTMELGAIVDRSAVSVFTKNAHGNYSHIAMAKRGFPSRTAAMKHIDTITQNNPVAKRNLEDITNMIYGRRINNESEGANKVTNALVDANIVYNLGAVAFSTAVEAMLTFALRNPIRGIANGIKVGVGNKNDFLVTIQDKVPLGISGLINKGNVRGFETNDATAMFGDRNRLGAITHKMKMATISYSGLSKISDFLQKVNIVTHTEMLATFLSTGKGLSKNRLTGYGINDDSLALLKGKLVFKNGNIQTPDFDTWTKPQIEAYANIISRMNEEVTLTRTIGGSGLWQARSNVGKLASSMLGYSTQLVSKQLVRGLKTMDMQTAKTSLLTFMGAYIGLYLRSEVEGKGYTDEQLLTYAMLNIPIAQPYSILMGLSNPSIVQTTKDMADAFKIQ